MEQQKTQNSQLVLDKCLFPCILLALSAKSICPEAARLLRGKHKPIFTPNVDTGDFVIIINAGQAVLTGNKINQKVMYKHSGYPGGLKETPYSRLMAEKPERALEAAVRGMLPKNRLGRKMIKKLKVFAGAEHIHQAQKPEVWNF